MIYECCANPTQYSRVCQQNARRLGVTGQSNHNPAAETDVSNRRRTRAFLAHRLREVLCHNAELVCTVAQSVSVPEHREPLHHSTDQLCIMAQSLSVFCPYSGTQALPLYPQPLCRVSSRNCRTPAACYRVCAASLAANSRDKVTAARVTLTP